jgi:uncharacterized protein (DUF4415 family)
MKRRKTVRRQRKGVRLKASAGAKRASAGVKRGRSIEAGAAGAGEGAIGRRERREPKKRITLFLDADILAWFKDQGPRYQRAINQTLREVMEEEAKGREG